jgi:hypothetical protein
LIKAPGARECGSSGARGQLKNSYIEFKELSTCPLFKDSNEWGSSGVRKVEPYRFKEPNEQDYKDTAR